MPEISFTDLEEVDNYIKMIGVGGAGSNMLNYCCKQNISKVEYIACNTDRFHLERLDVQTTLHLDPENVRGYGAGGSPEVGKKATLASKDKIIESIGENTEMLLVVAGMGGGTGTGAAPVIAEFSKKMNVLTIGVVTLPFEFEGEKKMNIALKGLEKLKQNVDSIIVIKNQNLVNYHPEMKTREAFLYSDKAVFNIVKSLTNIASAVYDRNVDISDIKQKLKDSGPTVIGTAIINAEEGVENAINKAISNDLLLYNSIKTAKRGILLVEENPNNEISIKELDTINRTLEKEAGKGFDFKTTNGYNEDSEDDGIVITVIATDFEKPETIELNYDKKNIYDNKKSDSKKSEQYSIFPELEKKHIIFEGLNPYKFGIHSYYNVEDKTDKYFDKLYNEPAIDRKKIIKN